MEVLNNKVDKSLFLLSKSKKNILIDLIKGNFAGIVYDHLRYVLNYPTKNYWLRYFVLITIVQRAARDGWFLRTLLLWSETTIVLRTSRTITGKAFYICKRNLKEVNGPDFLLHLDLDIIFRIYSSLRSFINRCSQFVLDKFWTFQIAL